MGNNISYSSDDEFLRVAMNLQKNELRKDLLNDLKNNSFFNGSFEICGLDLLLIKIKVNDLDKVSPFFKKTFEILILVPQSEEF